MTFIGAWSNLVAGIVGSDGVDVYASNRDVDSDAVPVYDTGDSLPW